MLKNLLTRACFGYKRYRCFGIKRTDIVLDVGAGPHPFFRADILCDLSTERYQKDGRPSVQADICNLPFHDKSIDFIYCSHVLEHVSEPQKALNELKRVGHRGYIATPSALWEGLFGNDREHKWVVEHDGKGLVFTPKDEVFYLHSEIARSLMKELFKLNPKVAGRFYQNCLPLWGIEYKWSGSIYFKINPGAPADIQGADFWDTVSYPNSLVTNLLSFARTLATWYSKLGRRSRRIELITLLRCSVCKAKLRQGEQGFYCQSCGAEFPAEDGVIKMLPDRTRGKESNKNGLSNG